MGHFELSNIASYAGLMTLILLLVAITWIALRSGSWHFARLRLWRFAHGKRIVKDKQIKAFLDDEADLAQFRYFLAPATNIYEARELMAWLSEAKLQPHEIRACGSYFDQELKTVVATVPSRCRARVSFAISTWLLGAVFAILLMAAGSSAAILRFKQSGQWFLLYTDSAKALFRGKSTFLRPDQCPAGQAIDPESKFSSADRASICEMFEDKTLPSYVERNVRSQRWSFGIVAAGIAFGLMLLWRHLRQVEAAWHLKRRLMPDSRRSVQHQSREQANMVTHERSTGFTEELSN